jgi:hypothetical protein
VFGGWQLATIVKWQSGAPLDHVGTRHVQQDWPVGPSDGRNVARPPNRSRACSGCIRCPTDDFLGQFRPSARWTARRRRIPAQRELQRPCSSTLLAVGNIEVNLFEGPSQFVTDLTVQKRVRFADATASSPVRTSSTSFNTVNWDFGDSTSTARPARLSTAPAARA